MAKLWQILVDKTKRKWVSGRQAFTQKKAQRDGAVEIFKDLRNMEHSKIAHLANICELLLPNGVLWEEY